MSVWIYTDADNTLWDTNAVFAEAQLALLEWVERYLGKRAAESARLEFVRRFDQAIALRHHSRLRYPPALLVRALTHGVNGETPDDAALRVLSSGSIPSAIEAEALSEYAEILKQVPPLLEGVLDGLRLAHKNRAPVYVISEGPIEVLRDRLKELALEQYVTGSLSAAKTLDLYVRLKQRASPSDAVMIGDQLDRDIRLAREAKMAAILVAGNFRPSWTRDSDASCASAVTKNFLEAVKWVLHLSSSQHDVSEVSRSRSDQTGVDDEEANEGRDKE